MIGASPPSPKCEISTTAAAKIDATPASMALPPGAHERRRLGREGPARGDDAVVGANLAAKLGAAAAAPMGEPHGTLTSAAICGTMTPDASTAGDHS